MVRDENGRERVGKPLNRFRFRILLREMGTGAKTGYTGYGTRVNQKIYRNALLFNRHSSYINITLQTPSCKLFFQKI